MHKEIKIANGISRPSGKIFVVYFSSSTGNTARFAKKLNFKNARIPISLEESINVNDDYVLVCPTYSGGGEFTKGAVPKQVIRFLNTKKNRNHCKGVIPTGNTNFNDTFCLAGLVLSKKLKVPILYQLELSGTQNDLEKTKKILINFWKNKDKE